MKKIVIFLLFFPIFLFSGVFEHLLDRDKSYLFEHNFRCRNSVCITSEKNIFDNEILEDTVKVVKVFLDNQEAVFKIEIELYNHDERREAFYDAIIKDSKKSGAVEYRLYDKNDKYGNHSFIEIVDKQKKRAYVEFLTKRYYEIMKSYKN